MIPGAKLLADFGEDLLGGSGSPGVHIVQALANRPEGVLTFGVGLVLVLPPGQNLIQGDIGLAACKLGVGEVEEGFKVVCSFCGHALKNPRGLSVPVSRNLGSFYETTR